MDFMLDVLPVKLDSLISVCVCVYICVCLRNTAAVLVTAVITCLKCTVYKHIWLFAIDCLVIQQRTL